MAEDMSARKKEVLSLQKLAEEEKRMFESDFREAYRFMMPRRVKPGYEMSTRPADANENFTTLGEEVTTDFASDMADTFTPEHAQWASIEIAASIDDSVDAEEAMEHETKVIFDAIRASNFHEACKQGNKDLAVSAFGLAIEHGDPGEAARCQVIPLTELLILRAPDGTVGVRFWKRKMRADDIRATFPKIDLPVKVRQALTDAKTKNNRPPKFTVLQGCYRDYSVPAETAWIKCTMIADELVETSRSVGVGSANILVCRWDPDPCYAWGNGPGIKAIADFRGLDETAYLKLKGMSRIIDPPVGFTDDGVVNLEGGLPNGVAIPMLEGSKIEVIESQHSVDAVLFATQEPTDRIRRLFYLDEPEQPGKTPPTAYQWQDEALRRQRRLGTPAAPIWPEFLAEAFMRFRYLLVELGVLQKGLPVGKQLLPIRPENPLKRAAQQEEAMASERVLTSLANLFGPQMLPMIVQVGVTCHNLVRLYHANGVKLQDAKVIDASITQMLQAQIAAQAAKAAAPMMQASQQKAA